MDVETALGSQEPVNPLNEVVINTGAIVPSQTVAPVGKSGKTNALTTAFTVLEEKQVLAVTVTVYNPLAANVAAAIVGFCSVEENPFGPVQLYVDPADEVEVKFKSLPRHIGDTAAVITGNAFIVITADVGNTH